MLFLWLVVAFLQRSWKEGCTCQRLRLKLYSCRSFCVLLAVGTRSTFGCLSLLGPAVVPYGSLLRLKDGFVVTWGTGSEAPDGCTVLVVPSHRVCIDTHFLVRLSEGCNGAQFCPVQTVHESRARVLGIGLARYRPRSCYGVAFW